MSLRSLLWHRHLLHSKMSSYSPKNPDPMSPIAGNKETKSHVLLQHLHRDLQVQVGFPLSRQTLGLLWISMATTHPGAIYSVASGASCACSGSHVNTWLLSLIISAVFSFTAAEGAKQEKHILWASWLWFPVQSVSLSLLCAGFTSRSKNTYMKTMADI